MKFSVACILTMCIVAAVAGEPIKVALAGSSACEGYGNTNPELIYGWGEVIGKYFNPDVKILNHGKSGYSTKSFINTGLWDKLLADKPDYILMTLGANDTKGKEFSTDVNTEYKNNLRRFASDADRIGAKIIFVTLNQSLKYNKEKTKAVFFNGKALRSDRIAYSQAIRDIAKELNRPCLELFENHRKRLEILGEEQAGKLYRIMPESGKIDPSHTNLAGAELVAEIIIDELKKSNSPLKDYLKK